MSSKKYLIIFVKNPVLGKVKTRLAESVGNMKALGVYLKLLEHTQTIVKDADCDKAVYYSDRIETKDCWNNGVYQKYLQEGENLGERMMNAFKHAFDMEYKQVVIIGSDCLEIGTHHIHDAFEKLNKNDIVLGPSTDGGYYLLGLNSINDSIFCNKEWSTSSVLAATLGDVSKQNLNYELLQELTDIDTEDDLKKFDMFLE